MRKTNLCFARAVSLCILLSAVLLIVPAVTFANGVINSMSSGAHIGRVPKRKMVAVAIPVNESISGTITAISGKDITVQLAAPNPGDPTTMIVHAGSAKIRKGSVFSLDYKKPKTVSDFEKIAKSSSTTMKSFGPKPFVKVSALSVGDEVSVSGTKNDDGTLGARRIAAHVKINTNAVLSQ